MELIRNARVEVSIEGRSVCIQAWRYTVNPPDGTAPPTTLKQPGFIGRGGH